jgi:hypothetical protein
MFPYEGNRDELEPKTWVAGIRINGVAKAYPIESMPSSKWIDDRVGETDIRVRYSEKSEHFEAQKTGGEKIPVVHAFWFAWQAFYPETGIHQ